MKIIRLNFLILSSFIFSISHLFAQKGEKYAVKLNTGLKITYSPDSSIHDPKYQWIFIPGFMIKNKRNKWREFQFVRNSLNETKKFESVNGFYYSSVTNIIGNDYLINVIKHNDLLKKKNTKLAFFISGQSTLGYGHKSKKINYSYGDEYISSEKYGIIYLKLTTRLGYDLSENIYIEYRRPNLISGLIRFGNWETINPLLHKNFRTQRIFDFDQTIAINLFNNPIKMIKDGFNLALTYKF